MFNFLQDPQVYAKDLIDIHGSPELAAKALKAHLDDKGRINGHVGTRGFAREVLAILEKPEMYQEAPEDLTTAEDDAQYAEDQARRLQEKLKCPVSPGRAAFIIFDHRTSGPSLGDSYAVCMTSGERETLYAYIGDTDDTLVNAWIEELAELHEKAQRKELEELSKGQRQYQRNAAIFEASLQARNASLQAYEGSRNAAQQDRVPWSGAEARKNLRSCA